MRCFNIIFSALSNNLLLRRFVFKDKAFLEFHFLLAFFWLRLEHESVWERQLCAFKLPFVVKTLLQFESEQ